MNDADNPVFARSVPQRRLPSDPGLGQRLSRELAEVRSQLEQSARHANRQAADLPLADRQRPDRPAANLPLADRQRPEQPTAPQPTAPPPRRTARDTAHRDSAAGRRAQLLVALLALTAIVLGGLHVVSSARDTLALRRTERLASWRTSGTRLSCTSPAAGHPRSWPG